MDDQHPPRPPEDDVSYEDFDDVTPPPEEMEVLDLDALDAPPKPPVSVLPPKRARPNPPAAKAEQQPARAEPPPPAQETSAPPRPERAPAPPPTDWVYYALLGLPPQVGARVLELRTAADINDMPPPGIALLGHFRTQALAAVQAELAHWARNHLPLQVEATAVWAEVRGQQQYVAAWVLQPAKTLLKAIEALQRALLLLVQPAQKEKPRPHVVIGERVAAARFPHLVAQMQRDFEPLVWDAAQAVLVRKDAAAEADTWEIVATYE